MTAFADPCDTRLALRAGGLLGVFNAAGVLNAADVHVALRLGRFGPEPDEVVLLAAGLAVRAPRLGHVHVDLGAIRSTVAVDADVPVDLAALPWPDPEPWAARVGSSPLVAVGEDGPPDRPLRLVGRWLYLDRYWRQERQVADDLTRRAELPASALDRPRLEAGLHRLFSPPGDDEQALAATVAVSRHLTVVAGGPGTGKTTTVARILALLADQARDSGSPPPLVALAAPTGKASARLEESVHGEAARIPLDDELRAWLLTTRSSTLHRLLGWQPGNRSRFRHHRGNRLPHDVIVVDETSMVSLTLMAKLTEAVRPDARLVLVGDPDQLASVEAGAVLGDIVGPAASGDPSQARERGNAALRDGIVVLRRNHRFGGGIAARADAVRRGAGDAAVAVAAAGPPDITWIATDPAEPGSGPGPIRAAAVAAGEAIAQAARAGDARAALEALGGFRLLCAHRRGPYGVAAWNAQVEAWLAAVVVPGFAATGAWYVGRPLLVTENDYALGLSNGDTGVVVALGGDRVAAVFERRGEIAEFSPARLAAVETVHVMTIHKSQGSQFDTVATVLPGTDSPILTRELLYTAVTRARRRLILAGTEDAVRAAVDRPVARASGLRRWLWPLRGEGYPEADDSASAPPGT